MADLSITPGNVVPVAGYTSVDGIAGATITAGQQLYLDDSTASWKLADSDASAATAALAGVALNGASAGQPIRVMTAGDYNPGATVAVGTIYVLSATPGATCPAADLVSGKRTSIAGVATAANNLRYRPFASGALIP